MRVFLAASLGAAVGYSAACTDAQNNQWATDKAACDSDSNNDTDAALCACYEGKRVDCDDINGAISQARESLDCDCVGSWSTCNASCEKTYSVDVPASGTGTCEAADNDVSTDCAPSVDACPAVQNCVATWSPCDENCEKTYSIETAASVNGTPCEAADGDVSTDCVPEVDGACPARDCVGAYGECDASCQKTYAHLVEASASGTACNIAAGHVSDDCNPEDGACPAQDCDASWSVCNDQCEKTYTITKDASANGTQCEADNGAVGICEPEDGACPARDCEGAYGECDASCQKTYAHLVEASANGTACDIAAGHVSDDCNPEDGACPAQDCVATWSVCNAACEKTYTITTDASANASVQCEAANNEVGTCAPEEGDCPAQDCVGAYGECDANCQKTYSVETAASVNGTPCEAANGDVSDECAPEDGECPAEETKTDDDSAAGKIVPVLAAGLFLAVTML